MEGRVETDIQVTPETLSLGHLKPGKESKFTVIVRSKKPVRIERVVCADHPECIKVAIPSEEKTTQMLSLVVTAPDAMGEFHDTFTVTIAGRSQPLTFQANGQVEIQTTAQDTSK